MQQESRESVPIDDHQVVIDGAPALHGAPGMDSSAVSDPVVLRSDRVVLVPVIGRLVPVVRIQIGLWIVALNLADVLLTKVIISRGGAEGNPLMRGLMAGFAAPVGTKVAVSAVAAVLLALCPPASRFADRAAATVAGLYLAIVAWNCAILICLTF